MRRLLPICAGPALASVLLMACANWPGSQPDRTPAAAIDEGMFVPINGIEQWLTVRGTSLDNPVLLWIHGGPGAAQSGLAPIFREWENHYTVVQWDQPGGGATYARNLGREIGPLSIERFTSDGLAVAEFVRDYLGADQVLLMAISWGSIVGLEMISRRPDLFSAYVGTGQHVSGLQGRILGYELALRAARERNDTTAVEALERVGPPPYRRLEDFVVRQQYVLPPALPPSQEEEAAGAEFSRVMSAPPPPDARYIARDLPAYDGVQAFLDTQRATLQEVQNWEAGRLGLTFTLPMFVFQGETDINTPSQLALDYCREIEAPAKKCLLIPGAGHNTLLFHQELLVLLNRHVRPLLHPPLAQN